MVVGEPAVPEPVLGEPAVPEPVLGEPAVPEPVLGESVVPAERRPSCPSHTTRLHGVDVRSPWAGLGAPPVRDGAGAPLVSGGVSTEQGGVPPSRDGLLLGGVDDPLRRTVGVRWSAPEGVGRRLLVVTAIAPRPVPDGPPAGRLVLDTVVAGQRLHWASADADGWRLRVPGLVDLIVAGGADRVTACPAPGVTDEQLVLLVRGLLLAFVLAVSGECVLHASAVTVAGPAAVAFAGPSGSGKSTLAAAACAAGAAFVTDDLLRVVPAPMPVWVGTAAELRLRPGAPASAVAETWTARQTPDGRRGLHPPTTAADSGPLVAVVLPRPTPGPVVRVRHLDQAAAALALVAAHRLVQWTDPAMLEAQLGHAVDLARTVPVLEVEVPWTTPVAPDVGERVLQAVLAAVSGRPGEAPHDAPRTGSRPADGRVA